jgi:transposase InsO family protein
MTELDQVFERMGVDCCGPLFKTSKGSNHYIVAIDMLSKWIVLIAVPDVKAMTVAKAIYEHVILTFGCPKELITDNAKTFTGTNFEEVMKLLGIKKLNCTPYHSDGNAITERPLRECNDMVAKYIHRAETDHEDLEWADLLKEIAWCHNVTPHSTTGMSPFFLMFGREPTFPIDILLEARKGVRKDPDMEKFKKHLVQTIEGARKFAVENMKKAMEAVKRQADKRAKESDIMVGELVLFKDTRKRVGMSEKFKNPWFTIHRVKAIKGQHAWIAPRDKPDDVPRRVHLNQIKRYYSEEERTINKELPKTTIQVPRRKVIPIRDKSQERVADRITRKGMKLRTLIYDEKGRSRPAKKN